MKYDANTYAHPVERLLQDEFNPDQPREPDGKWGGGSGVTKDKYGSIKTTEGLPISFNGTSRMVDMPLSLNPNHHEKTVIISHGMNFLGSAEHVGGKWQATSYSHNSVQQKHLDILNRAAPRGLRDIDPDEYTASGDRKGQVSLF